MAPKVRPTQAAAVVPAPAAPVQQARRTRAPNRTAVTRDHSMSPENFPGLAAVDAAPISVYSADDNPPVLVSPIKRRSRNAAPGINKQSDIDIWGLSDAEILGKS